MHKLALLWLNRLYIKIPLKAILVFFSKVDHNHGSTMYINY
jgi:hypothetical protein